MDTNQWQPCHFPNRHKEMKMTDYPNVIPLKALLKKKQQEVGNTQDWLGMAPEALEELIMEIEGLKWLDSQGDTWYPLF